MMKKNSKQNQAKDIKIFQKKIKKKDEKEGGYIEV